VSERESQLIASVDVPEDRGPPRIARSIFVLAGLVVLLLLAFWVTPRSPKPETELPTGQAATSSVPPVHPQPGDGFEFHRLSRPDRTVAYDENGAILATFTDGARTVVFSGPIRTFSEPKTTPAVVRTDAWVRLAPQSWSAGSETSPWFVEWFADALNDRSPDVLAIGMQYVDSAPAQHAEGVRYAGDASFGPLNPNWRPGIRSDRRDEESDFYDYLGVGWTFPDGVEEAPEERRYGSVDCSGFIRLVYGYRLGFPLRGDNESGPELPRRAFAMATAGPGVTIIPEQGAQATDVGVLQPGDVVFFEIDERNGSELDHAGIVLGLDQHGHPRFLSSREEANGPTLGDLGGTSRLDGSGFYAKGLRSAKRL
jgi:cell wall-associated NlpC family hydrolase